MGREMIYGLRFIKRKVLKPSGGGSGGRDGVLVNVHGQLEGTGYAGDMEIYEEKVILQMKNEKIIPHSCVTLGCHILDYPKPNFETVYEWVDVQPVEEE